MNDSTSSTIASPGNTAIHQARSTYPRPSDSIRPQLGAGGWVPSPTKDSAASARTANARLTEVWTMIGGAAFGRTWRNSSRRSEAPIERDARTYTLSRTPSTAERVTRANTGV